MVLSANMQRNLCFYTNLDQFQGVALVAESVSISYAELEARVVEQAAILGSESWQNDHDVCLAALEFERSIDAVVNYLAALRTQTPLLLLDHELPLSVRHHLFSKLGVSLVLSGQSVMQVAPRPFVNMQTQKSSTLHYPALLMSTSGSSGNPKSVMLSRENLLANTLSILDYLPIRQSDCGITTLPLTYSFGLSVLNTHLAMGATMVLTDEPLMSKTFWQQVKDHKVTSLSGVPFHYQMLRRLRIERMHLDSIKYLAQAGGRLAPEQVSHFASLCAERDWQFFVMYGQTEATARMGYVPSEVLESAPDVIGQAIPGGRFEIHDLDTNEVITDIGKQGELWYFGDNVMLGYAEQPSDWLGGRLPHKALATGDLAQWTEAGWVRITGRLSRFIKIQGKRYQLDHVEQQLHALGAEVVCCGRDDRLYLVCREVHDVLIEQLTRYARETLNLHPSLWALVEITDIPSLSSGKIDYQALITLCEQRGS